MTISLNSRALEWTHLPNATAGKSFHGKCHANKMAFANERRLVKPDGASRIRHKAGNQEEAYDAN